MAEIHEGGCACGKVRYRLTSAPMFVHCCHCTECQRLSGSAFAVNAPIEMDRVMLLAGEPQAQVVPTDTGRTQTILRCADCGVALWSHHPELRESIALIFTGTLNDARAFAPGAHCSTRSKQPWVVLPFGVQAAEGHYDLEACWPPESLKRLAAALGQT
jgi:hypothetical protein